MARGQTARRSDVRGAGSASERVPAHHRTSCRGILLLGGLYLTWRRVTAIEEGQVTERFTRAVEQLGSEQLTIRLGGIYSLERIARDSQKDHWTVMEVLTAVVRERSGSLSDDERSRMPCTDVQAAVTVSITLSAGGPERNRKPPAQAVLNGRLPIKGGAPGRIRTCDLPLRRRTLYPAELRAQHG